MNISNIRKKFIDYFVKHDHKHVESSSLIPHNDPTLMFTNSGMVQFKNVFTGVENRDYTKAVSSQKCVRAGGKHNDLENVGYTARHHTFFEMLGNFSFGDYFKESAIFFAWDLITKEFGISKDKLYVTVYHNDNDAVNYWKKISGLSDDRIIRISTNDNFWSMGDTGPCGPCSEIFYDYGDSIFGGLPGTKDQDGDRYVEIWNMVFMQFEQIDKNNRIPLPKQSIDTGMGLERIASVLQGKVDNYSTDLFDELISKAQEISGVKASEDNVHHFKVISDHLRSSCFLISDGVMPSNEGRGYVLRRIMRRSMRYVHQLGYKKPMLHQLVDTLVSLMEDAYPELKRAQKLVKEILYNEEEKFIVLLDKGLKILDDEISKINQDQEQNNNKMLSGNIAFKLYDTYGFPLDLTKDILKNKDMDVDNQEFNICMDEQRRIARESWVGSGESKNNQIWFNAKEKYGTTEFLGYSMTRLDGKILTIIKQNDFIKSASKDDGEIILISNQTPFYGESGGQMGDIGFINGSNEYGNFAIEVTDTKKYLGVIAHICRIKEGKIKESDYGSFEINSDYREGLRIHHSATHILHEVIRKKLGDHITQKGSLVAYDRLRFDISHFSSISAKDIEDIELEVNRVIRKNIAVQTKIMDIDSAISSGAMALFGEKYDSEVRVVSIIEEENRENNYSIELCGGTHVKRTGDIGYFKIISESSISSGIRRIDACCGDYAVKHSLQNDDMINSITDVLNVSKSEIEEKVSDLIKKNKKLEKDIFDAKCKSFILKNEDIAQSKKISNDINFICTKIDDTDQKILRSSMESNIKNHKNLLIVYLVNSKDKNSIIIASSSKISSLEIANNISDKTNGSGGGNEKIAQVSFKSDLNVEDVENLVLACNE